MGWALAAAALLACPGCSDSGDDAIHPGGGGEAQPSFADDIQPIFNASCATASCHSASATAGSLSLATGQSHAALVNVTAQQRPDLMRIRPAEPDSSYLYHRITGAGGVSLMPPDGGLSADPIELIRTWIVDGALND